jgi:hypothetical protein
VHQFPDFGQEQCFGFVGYGDQTESGFDPKGWLNGQFNQVRG